MFHRILCAVFIWISACHLSFGQESSALKTKIKQELSKIPLKKRQQSDFKKAYQFYIADSHDSAIVYSSQYLRLRSKDARLQQFTLFFRAVSFVKKGLYQEAVQDFGKIRKEFPIYRAVQFQQANLHLISGAYSEALQLFLYLKKQDRSGADVLSASMLEHNIGICYLHLEQYLDSESYLKRALDMQLMEKDTALIIGSYMDLANLYYEQMLDDQAIPYFQKAYELTKLIKDFQLRSFAALNMSVVEENRNDFEKSLEYRKEYDTWKDSLNDQQKVWEIAQVEKRHAAREKQREIHLLEVENSVKSKERNTVLIGAGLLLAILLLLIYFYRQKVKNNHLIFSQKERLDELNSFKNRLFSIVSHDLRSSVNGLRVSTDKLRTITAQRDDIELKKLIDTQGAIANSTFGLLDNLLNWALLQSDQIYFHFEKIKLDKVVEQVTHSFQPLLDQKGITLKTAVPNGSKAMADLDSFKIVLRNVLDNAIKFSPEGSEISIEHEESSHACQIRVHDQGPGMTEEQLEIVQEQSAKVSKQNKTDQMGTGLGVRLCQSFMLKNEGSFQISSEIDKGTTITLTLNLNLKDE